jgi:hypothetical protein
MVPTLWPNRCNRQLASSELINRPADVTRSTVQKAVVVLASRPVFVSSRRGSFCLTTDGNTMSFAFAGTYQVKLAL